ncbi:amidohydrolase/deacetylase family metallohydrolase [Paractinoplanes ferrugineus]|uniref:Amidohydrolase n=1 Tax=Paractinoplanes ferrugineus TaxID=113564 RepID=A0A919MA85_9ACTN|nr:amidohydrolase/deacetylase family metallohydrolase [Actinoplanes ferrugineus]GIE12331.1 amidohydrolase [Actinoplanes ferrugineus]
MSWDLLLAGGEPVDVAVRDGRIAATGKNLARERAAVVEDVAGLLVTPGLIDLHTHVGPGYWGIEPDPIAWHTGVTTWVDAGTAGAFTADGLLRRDFDVRVAGLLNISGIGLTGRTGESRDLVNCDVALAVDTVQRHRDRFFGIKVRIDRETVGDNGVEPLRRALRVGETCGVPVMVHVGAAPPAVDEVLDLLRPGDIVTHCASGLAAPIGPRAVAAGERGVLFDLGHGSGGFAFDVLERQLELGLRPYTISTDLHARSVHGPAFDLPTTMAKMLAVGLPMSEVLDAVTVAPARALGLDGGTFDVGATADIAVFALEYGAFEVTDAHLQTRTAPVRLVNTATYRKGQRLTPRLPANPAPWIPLTDAQRAALARRERDLRRLLNQPLVGRDGLADQFPRTEKQE